MARKIHPVILCGGSGTRLWPLSRKSFPKQFALTRGGVSLFQSTVQRFTGAGMARPLAVTASEFRFMVAEQMRGTGDILIEPEGRNTAPAIAAAALYLEERASGALMLIAPSDHEIADGEGFMKAVRRAVPAADAGQIVTFGIKPDRAETGYGWLEVDPLAAEAGPRALRCFIEKPTAEAAEAMLASGGYLWNAGIFLATTDAVIEAFERYAPDILVQARVALQDARHDLEFLRLAKGPWARMPNISVDYAVMEKAENLVVMPYGGAWSDLGNWDAVWRSGGEGTVTEGPVTALDCEGSLLRAEVPGQQLVGIGLEDMVVVAMPDAVLVAPRARAQEVKAAVEALKEKGATQAEEAARDYRPWGWGERLATGGRFQVKRIVVKPGGALSLQSHHHRAEHWIVVEGTARVQIGDQVKLVSENESVYIPLGAMHRLENPGKMPLTLIEVQTGSYLGEDDITRYEDIYAREPGE